MDLLAGGAPPTPAPDFLSLVNAIATSPHFGWLRELVGGLTIVVSGARVLYPLYAEWRRGRGGTIETPEGPVSTRHAVELAFDENLKLQLRNESLTRALEAANARVERARADREAERAMHRAELESLAHSADARLAAEREEHALEARALRERIAELSGRGKP